MLKRFAILYNSYEYFDEELGCRTYQNEVATYLVLYLKKNKAYEKYGTLRKSKYIQTDDGNVVIDLNESEQILNNWDSYTNNQFGNFYFKDEMAYLEVAVKAQDILYSEEFKEACKSIHKKRNDKALMKERTLANVYGMANDKKLGVVANMEANKLLGKWLHLEEPEEAKSINVIIQSLEKELNNIE